jgi:hypothetical protein
MVALETPQAHGPPRVRPSAVVWIGDDHAIVARVGYEGTVSTCEIARGAEPELSYLALVVGAIGERERVLIMGSASIRLALEREYLALHRRPDRLVDVDEAPGIDHESLVDRLRELAG